MASELREPRWTVISVRGSEKSGLTYEAAVELLRRLNAEKVRSLCITTDEAARRLATPNNLATNSPTT